VSDNYKYRDVRIKVIRERVTESLPVDEPYDWFLCAECGAIISDEETAYELNDDHSDHRVWCSMCIEEWSPLEEEGRVPVEYREPV
jgi:hypothetical protein